MYELFRHLMPLDFKWVMLNYGTVIYTILFLVIFIFSGNLYRYHCSFEPDVRLSLVLRIKIFLCITDRIT